MKRWTGEGWPIALSLVIASLVGVGAPGPAAAQDHDLVMFSLDANPKPLERGCTAQLFGSFLINGHMDAALSSGAAAINFYWADGANPVPTTPAGWSSAGTLSVTWSASDGVFAAGREWPTGFPSVAGTTKAWSVPTSATSFHLKAEVDYTASGISDDVPGNNQAIVPSVPSVEGDCGDSCCTLTSSGTLLCSLKCFPEIVQIPERDFICLVRPERCQPPPIPLCELIPCPPCLRGLTCPPFEWEILVSWPPEVMRLELLARDELIARSEKLRRPIDSGGEVFYQALRFTPEQGLDYSMRSLAGPKADVGKIYPLALEARQLEGKGRY